VSTRLLDARAAARLNKQFCRPNRDGSFATQRDRKCAFDLAANQPQEAGYRHLIATILNAKRQCAAAGIHRMHGLRRQQPAGRGHGN